MTKLTKTQIEILTAACADTGAPIEADRRSAMTPLVKKGFLIIVPNPAGNRMIITEAGRAQLAELQPAPSGEQGRDPPFAAAGGEPAAEDASPTAACSPAARAEGGKTAVMLALLRRPEGARLEELMQATGWQPHSVRGAISGAIKKKQGIVVTSEKVDGIRLYRAEPQA